MEELYLTDLLEKKPKMHLEIGREYIINEFPLDSPLQIMPMQPERGSKYLGEGFFKGERYNLFSYEGEGRKNYMLLKNNDFYSNGLLVAPINNKGEVIDFNIEDLDNFSNVAGEESSKLLNILNKLGEKI